VIASGSVYTPLTYFFLALSFVAFGVEAFAFIDAIRRPSQAFPATGKRTKVKEFRSGGGTSSGPYGPW